MDAARRGDHGKPALGTRCSLALEHYVIAGEQLTPIVATRDNGAGGVVGLGMCGHEPEYNPKGQTRNCLNPCGAARAGRGRALV